MASTAPSTASSSPTAGPNPTWCAAANTCAWGLTGSCRRLCAGWGGARSCGLLEEIGGADLAFAPRLKLRHRPRTRDAATADPVAKGHRGEAGFSRRGRQLLRLVLALGFEKLFEAHLTRPNR